MSYWQIRSLSTSAITKQMSHQRGLRTVPAVLRLQLLQLAAKDRVLNTRSPVSVCPSRVDHVSNDLAAGAVRWLCDGGELARLALYGMH